jgi:ferredoxin-NADP reductase/phenylpropionate dioxygenase-like ring-hydroxylating dioxygenase large terminal subunit/ferredoxin
MNQPIEDPASLLAALNRGESLPAHWYTDSEITQREIHRIFRKTWGYVGPLKELTNQGDYIAGYIGEIPVVVLRNESGLAAFVNVCRHRRHEVMKGRGNAKMMQCGYHAWVYDLTGCLKGAPRSATEPNFQLADYPLLSLKVDTLGPWVFVNADPAAEPVRAYFGNVLDIIAESGLDLDTLEFYSRDSWVSQSNWKTMLENYLECYHCAIAHPGFSAAIDVQPENYDLAAHGWLASQVGHVRQSALEGKSAVKIYDARGDVAQSQYHLLFPNLTININPGFPNLSLDIWMPDGPNGTKGFSEQYFGPGVTEEFAAALIAFNVEVGKEDDDLTNSVQRGLIAGIPARGRFLTNSEHLVVHFQKLVVNCLTGDEKAQRVDSPIAQESDKRTVPAAPDASQPAADAPNAYVPLEVFNIEPESEVITSFYLRRVDGKKLAPWEPGQFLPIRVTIPGQDKPALRTYTLSTAANPDHYRLSIRRGEGNALVSRFMHASVREGFRIEAMSPRGKFVLKASGRPVVLLSGGVGLTPMIAMATHLVEDGKRTGKFRPVYFIHGTNHGGSHAFAKLIDNLKSQHPGLKSHICYSEPRDIDKLGKTHDTVGHVTMDVLKQVLPFGQHDFYLCGPPPFMKTLHDGLLAVGVPKDQIHYESFGAATVPKTQAAAAAAKANGHDVAPAAPPAVEKPVAPAALESSLVGPVQVRFAKSGVEGKWTREKGTLLEFAEGLGLAPAFACRSGICGTCTTRITAGGVHYVEEPIASRGAGDVLLCCSIPRAGTGEDEEAVVLDA